MEDNRTLNLDVQNKDHQSDGSSEDKDVTLAEVTAKRRKQHELWTFVQEFDNLDKAVKVVEEEDTWSFHYYNKSEGGVKKYYKCNKLNNQNPQCSAKIFLSFGKASDSVYLYKTVADHNHDKKDECSSKHGMNDSVEKELDNQLRLKTEPTETIEKLNKITHSEVLPAESAINLEELEAWILSHTELSFDRHEPFVISHQIDSDDGMKTTYTFVISTKHLIEIAKGASVLHLDSRYKIIWQGFSVFVCGTTDQNQRFHPLCLVVASREEKEDFKLIFEGFKKRIQECHESIWSPKVLVCDGRKSMQDAFFEVFGEDVVVRVCWVSTRNQIEEKLENINDELKREEILQDIEVLHLITDANMFHAAASAFMIKYDDELEFIDYFKEHWLQQNCNWFLGAAANSPATNNALEYFHNEIKDDEMRLKECALVPLFLETAEEIVNEWSLKYCRNPEENAVAQVPSINLKDWRESYIWAKTIKEVTKSCHSDENYTYYSVPADQGKLCIFTQPWETLDEFEIQHFSQWIVAIPNGIAKHGKCSCPTYNMMYKCKHVLGLAIHLKYVDPPLEATRSCTDEANSG